MREILAESRLAVEEARARVDKSALKAKIPEILLASRDYRENQLILKHSKLTRELKEAELEKEIHVQDTEAEIDFIMETWSELRDRPAELLREDFCGTASAACEWVRQGAEYKAQGDLGM